MKKIITQDQENFIIENYPLFGGKYCAEKLGFPNSYIMNRASRLRLKSNPEKLLKIRRNNMAIAKNKKENKPFNEFNVNPEQFLNIQTPEIAYILGLLWADGYIYQDGIKIECKREDLETLSWVFDKTGKWCKNYRNRKNRQPQMMIGTNNKHIRRFLEENDYIAKSISSADKILSKIPDHLKHYWFRGLVDGDGCFYINQKNGNNIIQFSIASSYKQDWNFVENLLKILDIKYKIVRREQKRKNNLSNTSNSIVRITSRCDILKFGNYIYKNMNNDNIGLKRKYEKFLQIEPLIKRIKTNKPIGIFNSGKKWRANYNKITIGSFHTQEEAIENRNRYLIENNLIRDNKTEIIYNIE